MSSQHSEEEFGRAPSSGSEDHDCPYRDKYNALLKQFNMQQEVSNFNCSVFITFESVTNN